MRGAYSGRRHRWGPWDADRGERGCSRCLVIERRRPAGRREFSRVGVRPGIPGLFTVYYGGFKMPACDWYWRS